MVRDYVTEIYEPLADRANSLSANGFTRAKSLAAWKAEVREAWPAVKVEGVATESAAADLGAHRMVTATVDLGPLAGGDVAVQLLHGAVGPDGELLDPTTVIMHPIDGTNYVGTLTCDSAGRYGYTVRIVPSHPDLGAFVELGCVAWVDQGDAQP
jgi:starch phosphorylase